MEARPGQISNFSQSKTETKLCQKNNKSEPLL